MRGVKGLYFGLRVPPACRSTPAGFVIALREIKPGFSSMLTRVCCSGNGLHRSLSSGVNGQAARLNGILEPRPKRRNPPQKLCVFFLSCPPGDAADDTQLHCSSFRGHASFSSRLSVPIGWSVPTWQSLIGCFRRHFLCLLKMLTAGNKAALKENIGVFF